MDTRWPFLFEGDLGGWSTLWHNEHYPNEDDDIMPQDYSLAVTPANRQRRPKNAMSDEWVKDFLRQAAIGRVATRWDEQPFITPTSFWYDEAQHAIIFH
ncbi:MAG TPA: hypothetical protein VMP08_20630, partial [Anaerolineae bacterium]|nr:hypothetical protein [Anaerolineae bacterium]